MVVLSTADSRQDLSKLIADKLTSVLTGSLQRKINIALSGGSSGLIIADSFFSLDKSKYDIKNCNFFFADERVVPLNGNYTSD